MPTPKPNESKEHYISRCLIYPDLQSKPEKERLGECEGLWAEHHKKEAPVKFSDMGDDLLIHFGGAVKAIDGSGRVGGYLVRFGSGTEKDTSDEYFDKETYLGPADGDGAEALFHHAQPVLKGLEHLADRTFQPISTKRDELGIWAETVLDMADEYERKVFELAQKGKLGWSSGSAPHRVKKMRDGRITSWPICEGSLTPEPAEPRNKGGILPLKSLKEITMGIKSEAAALPAEDKKPEEEKTKAEEHEMTKSAALASIAKSLKAVEAACAKLAEDEHEHEEEAHKDDGDGDGDEAHKDDGDGDGDEATASHKDAMDGDCKAEEDKETEEEYKNLSPAQKAWVDHELAEIAKNQKIIDRNQAVKTNHNKRLANAARGRGLTR